MDTTKKTIQLFFTLALISGGLWSLNSCDDKDDKNDETPDYHKGYTEIDLTSEVLNGTWNILDELEDGKSVMKEEGDEECAKGIVAIFNSKDSTYEIKQTKSGCEAPDTKGTYTYTISDKHMIKMKNSKGEDAFHLCEVKVYKKENKYQLEFRASNDEDQWTYILSKDGETAAGSASSSGSGTAQKAADYHKGYAEIDLTDDVLNGTWNTIDILNKEEKSIKDEEEDYECEKSFVLVFNSTKSTLELKKTKKDCDDELKGTYTYTISDKHTIKTKNGKGKDAFSLSEVKVYKKENENKYHLQFTEQDEDHWTRIFSKE